MSAGCAIITSNVTGCPEVVGDVALLVRPESSEDIRNAVIKLIGDDELISKLGFKARKRVEERFTWKKIAKQYVSVYEEVIEKGVY
jgi:glycosyltransferase involved in cell wall biosynthesis